MFFDLNHDRKDQIQNAVSFKARFQQMSLELQRISSDIDYYLCHHNVDDDVANAIITMDNNDAYMHINDAISKASI